MTQKTFAIYIPAYNAELTIAKVLDRLPQELKLKAHSILVVDNQSSDKTTDTVLSYKSVHGLQNLHVIRLPANQGYGGSQKIGYRYCVENKIDVVAMVHADGQYAPEILQNLMEPVTSGRADMVFGSRIRGNPLKGGMPLHRFLGNRALTMMQNFFLGSSLSEFHSGYRIFDVPTLAKIPFEQLSDDYHFDTEMIILQIRNHSRIVEIPISTHYGDEENYVNIWAYGTQVLVTTLTYVLHKNGLRKSRNWKRILDFPQLKERETFVAELIGRAEFNGTVSKAPSLDIKRLSGSSGV